MTPIKVRDIVYSFYSHRQSLQGRRFYLYDVYGFDEDCTYFSLLFKYLEYHMSYSRQYRIS